MKHILSCSLLIAITASQASLATNNQVPSKSCPAFSLEEIKSTASDRVLKVSGHKWYMVSIFELQESLGNHVPLELTVEDLKSALSVSQADQLDQNACQYKLMLPKDKHVNVTYKLMGD